MEEIYARLEDGTHGPFNEQEVVALAHKGVLRPTDMVRLKANAPWTAAASVRFLRETAFQSFASPSPADEAHDPGLDAMAAFPQDILDKMRSCIVHGYPLKSDLQDFFMSNGCTRDELRDAMKQSQHLKRDAIVSAVFAVMIQKHGGGLEFFRSILLSLLTRAKQVQVRPASDAFQKAMHDLTSAQEAHDARIKAERKRKTSTEQRANEQEIAMAGIRSVLMRLSQGLGPDGAPISHQERGYHLESLLKDFFATEKLLVADPFRIQGEQIDGGVEFKFENYIIEAKWHDAHVASNALYQFAHKVVGKLAGRGLFISINGYSRDSVIALQHGKALNVILVDGQDIMLVADGRLPLLDMLDRKVQAAQLKGMIYIDPITGKSKVG